MEEQKEEVKRVLAELDEIGLLFFITLGELSFILRIKKDVERNQYIGQGDIDRLKNLESRCKDDLTRLEEMSQKLNKS